MESIGLRDYSTGYARKRESRFAKGFCIKVELTAMSSFRWVGMSSLCPGQENQLCIKKNAAERKPAWRSPP